MTLEEKREYHRGYYWMLKRNHRCTKCQKKDAYTLAGHSRCFECNEKRRKTPTDFVSEKKKRKQKNPREYGVRCWICNKNEPMDGYKLCPTCHEKALKALEVGRQKLRDTGYYKKRSDKWHKIISGKH